MTNGTDSSHTLTPLPDVVHSGLSAISTFALLSLFSTAALFGYLCYHVLAPDRHRIFRVNQYVALLINLFLAELIQAIGFSLSLQWLRLDGIWVSHAISALI